MIKCEKRQGGLDVSILQSTALSNILTGISIVVTIISIIKPPTRKNSTSKTEQITKSDVPATTRSSHRFANSAADAGGEWVALIVLLALGKNFYPYRHTMFILFFVFWWIVLVVVYRFTKKEILARLGPAPIRKPMVMAIFTMISLAAIDNLPPILYSSNELAANLYQPLIMGCITFSYLILVSLGVLLIVAALSKPESKLSQLSVKWLYRFQLMAMIPLIGDAVLIIIRLLFANK